MTMGEMARVMDQARLPDRELAFIFRQGAILRLPYLEGRLLQAGERVRTFEEKYGTTLDVLAFQGLPDDAGYEMHEDFIEWEYWNDVLHKVEVTAGNVRSVLEKVEETVGAY